MEQQTSRPRYGADKIALAQGIYRDFYTACFWHMRPDLVINEATIPILIRELRVNGGMAALRAAAQLEE